MPPRRRSTAEKGRLAEQLAEAALVARGYRVVARNHRCAGGELDLVAFDGDVLCFIEVRSGADGDPLETIDRRKIRRIGIAARDFLTTVPNPWPRMRFDAVGVVTGAAPSVHILPDAFELE